MIEYFAGASISGDASENELSPTGEYFICYDVVQNKITGYFKQAFMKNCQKLILEAKAQGHCGHTFGVAETL